MHSEVQYVLWPHVAHSEYVQHIVYFTVIGKCENLIQLFDDKFSEIGKIYNRNFENWKIERNLFHNSTGKIGKFRGEISDAKY